MDTRTGEIFELDADGQLAADASVGDDEKLRKAMRLLEARDADSLVEVSERVATAQRLGQRELLERFRRDVTE